MTLNEKNVGDIVKIKENGVDVNYIVVQKGNPSGNCYDDSCDGIWLLRENAYMISSWNYASTNYAGSSYTNDYANSIANQYLNKYFINVFSQNLLDKIKTVKIPYIRGTSDSGNLLDLGSGLPVKIFLLSSREVSLGIDSAYAVGINLTYFTSASCNEAGVAQADRKKASNNGGSPVKWWLRDPRRANSYGSDKKWHNINNRVSVVGEDGADYTGIVNPIGISSYSHVGTYCDESGIYLRPAFVLPHEITIDNNNNIIGETVKNIAPPYLENSSFNFSNNTITPVLKGVDYTYLSVSGTLSGVSAGKYTINISLIDPETTAWEDGTTDDIILEWEIKPVTITKPTVTPLSLEYNGSNQSVAISEFDSALAVKTGTETAKVVGIYNVIFSLKDPSSSSWDNGDGTTTTDDIIVEWQITKKICQIPTLKTTEFTYNGNYYAPTLDENYNSIFMNYTGVTRAYSAGEYSIVVSLRDTTSTEWEDGTIENKALNWKINKKIEELGFPTISPTEFIFNNAKQAPMVTYGTNGNSDKIAISGTTSAITACLDEPYKIIFSLKQNNNNITYVWEDNTTDDYTLTWRINKAILPLPTIEKDTFEYNGKNITANVSSYDTNLVTRTGTISVANAKAGEYLVYYSLRDNTSSEWEDGTIEDKKIIWRINKSKFTVPTAKSTSLEVMPTSVHYQASATTQYLDLNDYDSAVMTVTGNYGAYPNTYTAIFKLKDIESASWADGSVDDKTIEWQITKKEYLVKKPSLVQDTFQYNGLSQIVSFNDRNDNVMTVAGELSGIPVREYKALVSLKDSNVYNFKWEDGSIKPIELDWKIQKSSFVKPTLEKVAFDYNGLTQSVKINGFNSNVMEYGEEKIFSAMSAGEYSIIVSLKDKKSATWEDGSTNDIILLWNISKSKFDVPAVTNTEFTYSGGGFSPTIQGYNSNVMTLKGVSYAINAGQYVFSFVLKDPYSASWSDNTTEEKKFRWIINKADYFLAAPHLSASEFTYNGRIFIFYVSDNNYETTRGYVNSYVRGVKGWAMAVGGMLRTSSAGEHIITVTLKQHNNYILKWNDGSTDPLQLKWVVNKAVFEIPTISSNIFYFGGKIPEYKTDSDGKLYVYRYRYGNVHAGVSGFNAWVMEASGITTGYYDCYFKWIDTSAEYYEDSSFHTTTQWRLGKYYARFYLKDPASATWSDGTNGEITLEWTIVREIVLITRPYLQTTSYEYDGTEKEPIIINNASGLVLKGTRKETEVGNYSIVASLYREFSDADTKDYRWDDNTVDDIIVMNWNIWSNGKIATPCISPTEFKYNGKERKIVVSGFNENTMKKEGAFSATKAGEYSVTFSLKHPDSVTWSDGTTEDKTLTWEITKGTAYLPYLNPDDLMYDEHSHPVKYEEDKTGRSYVVYNYNPDLMACGGDLSATYAGEYKVVVALKDKTSCVWADGTTDNIELPFTVSKKTILLDIPLLKDTEFMFDNTTKTPEILLWGNKGMVKSGDLSAIKAGQYKITISLAEDPNITYLWSDHSETDIELDWEIKGRAGGIEKPFVTSLEFSYDGEIHAPDIADCETNLVNCSGIKSSVNAGEYEICFSLIDKDSCTWTDGTTDDYIVSWTIKKAPLSKPTLKQGEFTYNGEAQEPLFDDMPEEGIEKAGDINARFAGDYNIKITPDNNHEWEDGNSEELSFDWCIKKSKFPKPTLKQGEFTYNGEAQEPLFDGFDKNVMQKTKNVSETAAGEYEIVISFIDTNSSEWDTSSDKSDTAKLKFDWVIKIAGFDMPFVSDLLFVYDGSIHAPKIDGYNEKVMNILGTSSSVNAGDFEIIFSLKDINSAHWNDNTTDNKKITWKVEKMAHDKPYLTYNEFSYNGGIHAPTVRGLDVGYMNVSGEQSGIGAGIYYVIIPLNDPTNHKWKNGDSEPLSLEWIIHGKPVGKPHLDENIFQYTGIAHTPIIIGFVSSAMNKSGDLSATAIGAYKIIISLTDNYEWSDGGFTSLELPWQINKVVVKKPSVTDTDFIYNKTLHSPKINDYNKSTVVITGTQSAINAGDYAITFSLKDSEATWADGTKDDIVVPWVIHKKTIEIPTLENTDFVYNGGKQAPIVNVSCIAIYIGTSVYNYNSASLLKQNCEVYYYGYKDGIDAKTYSLYFRLFDTTNYEWEDGSIDEIAQKWVINKKPISKPYLDPEQFEYSGNTRTVSVVGFDNRKMTYLSPRYGDYKPPVFSAVELGEYEIKIGLFVTRYYTAPNGDTYETRAYNYKWEDDGTSDILTLKWKIVPCALDYPYLIEDEYEYTGGTITPSLFGYISGAMKIEGDGNATNVGNYQISFILKDTKNFHWKIGASDGKKLSWKINRAKLSKSKLPYLEKDLVYNSLKQTPHWLDYDIRKLKIGGTNEAIDVGEYYTEFSPTDNYIWDDGTLTPITKSWRITKLGLMTPKQSAALYYNGEVQSPKWVTTLNHSKNITFTGETTGKYADEYYVNCECDSNCYFIDTGTTHCSTYWTIRKRVIYQLKGETYRYTGKQIEAKFSAYYLDALKKSGQTVGTDIGKYIALFEIIDPANNRWADSVILQSEYNGKLAVPWYIVSGGDDEGSQAKVPIPRQSNYLVYNGERQSPVFEGYNKEKMTLLGVYPSEIDADTYYVKFRLKSGYVWTDNTTEDKRVPWVIHPQKVPFPYILTSEADNGGTDVYYYEIDGKRYPIWVNYKPEIMKMTGDTYDIDFSWHTTYFELKDKKNYVWIEHNEAYEKYPVSWKLSKAYVRDPVPTTGRKIHIPKQANHPIEDGTTKYPKWDYYDNNAIHNLGGEWEGIAAGERYVILELQEGYIWEDDTDEIKAVPWKIFEVEEVEADGKDLIPLPIPEQINPPYYNRLVQYPEWDTWADYGFDIVWGVLMEVPAGQYKIKLRLKTGYIWEDGTVEDKIVTWVINPYDFADEDIPEDDPDEPKEPEKETEEIPEEEHGDNCCCCCCNSDGNSEIQDSVLANEDDINDLFTKKNEGTVLLADETT